MGCCNTRNDSTDNELLADRNSKIVSVLEQESDGEKVRGRNMEVPHIHTVDQHENDNDGVIPTTFRRQDQEITNRTDMQLLPDTVRNEQFDDEGIKPKKKAKSKIPITVAQSEPQNLDPNNVYFVENKIVSPVKSKSEIIPKMEIIIKRQETVDKILEEKIKNKVDFEELLNDGQFDKFIK
jgi:hypothetical protein